MDAKLIKPGERSKGSAARWLKIGIVLTAMVTTVLFVVPLTPRYPAIGLDASWEYALNEAVAQHLVFGRDIVFTFGPLAPVYTKMYHPATDWIMLLGSALVGAGLAVGCALLAYPKRPWYAVISPFLVAEILVPGDAIPNLGDAIFIFLPFLLLLLVFRVCASPDNAHYLRPGWFTSAGIAIVTCSVALLPLVKGSFAGAALFSGGLSFFVLLRRRPLAAVAFACLAIASASGAWVATGQPIGALPDFFGGQSPIISGYSEAMSADGAPQEIVVYVVISIILLGVFSHQFARRFGRFGLIAIASFAFTLFVVFKAAFVRHDSHALTAAGALLLGGYCVSTMTKSAVSLMVGVLVVFGWAYIDNAYSGLDILKASQRVEAALARTYSGIKMRESTPQKLRTVFDRQNGAIRAQLPLPPVEGTVDIYEYESSTLFAHGLRWEPRPVFQSYSAYSSRLDALNVAHLNGPNAPQSVFFQVTPIDGRLPALEDAGSWPLLLARYCLVARTGDFLLLVRGPGVFRGPETQGISTSTERLGHQFNLPKSGEPLWAEVDVKPTLLGRMLAALFKPAHLHILFRFVDGRTETYRYVSAMGRSGFMISPVIHDTVDFAAVLMTGRERYFSDTLPTTVEISGDAGSNLFWKPTFKVHLCRIELPFQFAAEKLVYDEWLSDPTMNQKIVGSAQCSIDAINRKLVTTQSIEAKGPLLVQGWAAFSAERGIPADEVFVAVAGEDGSFRAARARTVPRPDVNAYFKHPEMGAVGFEAFLDTTEVKGRSKLQIYVKRHNQFFSCPVSVEIR